jgi:SNF2 family DNA or RNA helicase
MDQVLAKKIGPHACYANKNECLDLPPLITTTIDVELSSEQRRIYDSLKKAFVAEVDGGVVVADFVITKSIRMQQVLAGFIPVERDGEPDDSISIIKDTPRVLALEDLLESLRGQKVIIWTTFRPSYKIIGT